MLIPLIQYQRVVDFMTRLGLKNTLSYFKEILMISFLKCFIRRPCPQLSSERYTLLNDDENHKLMNAIVSNRLFTQFCF